MFFTVPGSIRHAVHNKVNYSDFLIINHIPLASFTSFCVIDTTDRYVLGLKVDAKTLTEIKSLLTSKLILTSSPSVQPQLCQISQILGLEYELETSFQKCQQVVINDLVTFLQERRGVRCDVRLWATLGHIVVTYTLSQQTVHGRIDRQCRPL